MTELNYTPIGRINPNAPLKNMVNGILLLSSTACVTIVAIALLGYADIMHAYAGGAVLIANAIVYYYAKRLGTLMSMNVILTMHTLVFAIPLFIEKGVVSDLAPFPVLLCWASMVITTRLWRLIMISSIIMIGTAGLYYFRAGISPDILQISLLHEGIVCTIVMLTMYVSLYAFFKTLDNYKFIKDGIGARVKSKNAILQKQIHSNQQLENYAHSASTVLNTPVGRVALLAQEFFQSANDRLTDQEKAHLVQVTNQARQMQALTADLYELSTLSAAKTDTRSVNTSALIQRLIDHNFADQKDFIKLGRLPLQINVNPNQIHTLLKNVIDNAIKYAHPLRTPEIIISASTDEQYHTFRIIDNGKGISDEQKQKAFVIFNRLETSGEGTGIGLATCKRIVEKHEGKITLLDNPNGGLIFQFTLPI